MPSDTWTPTAVASNSTHFEAVTWRLVNQEGKSATSKVVDTPEEVDALENLMYRTRETINFGSTKIHRLLRTPFNTKTGPRGSRFKPPNAYGAYYAAQSLNCAAAEKGYHNFLFLKDSPDLQRLGPTRHNLIEAIIKTEVIDVRLPPYAADKAIFESPNDYARTQEFGKIVSVSEIGGIVYKSVRHQENLWCIALLTPTGFPNPYPSSTDENWECSVINNHVNWIYTGSLGEVPSITFIF